MDGLSYLAPSALWSYIVGTGCISLGVVVIFLWRIRHPARIRGRYVPFAVAVSTLLIGSALLATAAYTDFERYQSQRTWTFRYVVDVHRNGTLPVRLHLPAPVDPRLAASLESSNGTSTLRYEAGGTAASVVTDVVSNVSFDVQLRYIGSEPDWTLARVSERAFSQQDQWNQNVSLELTGSGGGLVQIRLRIEVSVFCL